MWSESRPAVPRVDSDLGYEAGFELAEALSDRVAADSSVILVSTHSEEEFGELIAASPALGFIAKTQISARAIRELLDAG